VERIGVVEPPWAPDVAAQLAALMPPGVEPLRLFRTLAHNPRVLGKIRAANLLDRGSLARIDRELAILRTCARCRCEYEWGVHVAVFARRYGIPEDKLAGTVLWDARDARWTPRERAVVRLVDELHDAATASDAAWKELRASFQPDQIVELLVLVGFYHAISFVANALSIELEASATRFPPGEVAASPRPRAPSPPAA